MIATPSSAAKRRDVDNFKNFEGVVRDVELRLHDLLIFDAQLCLEADHVCTKVSPNNFISSCKQTARPRDSIVYTMMEPYLEQFFIFVYINKTKQCTSEGSRITRGAAKNRGRDRVQKIIVKKVKNKSIENFEMQLAY